MRMLALWLSLTPLLLTACASCSSSSASGNKGGSSSGGGSGSGGASGSSSGGYFAPEACADYAKAVCSQYDKCTPFEIKVVYGDEPTCEQRVRLACTPAVEAPGTTISPNSVGQCAVAYNSDTCAELLDNAQPSACAFVGSVAVGGACGSDMQCSSGYCRLALASTCGTCATRAQSGQAGPDGGPACIVDTDCAATLICGNGKCVAPGAMGAACSTSAPCSRTLACIGGSCATPYPVGHACSAATDCDGANGAVCDMVTTKACIATGTAAAGAACGVINKGLTVCTAGATCENVSTAGIGTCHQPAADGAPCGPGIGCTSPAVCTTSAKCTLPAPSSCH